MFQSANSLLSSLKKSLGQRKMHKNANIQILELIQQLIEKYQPKMDQYAKAIFEVRCNNYLCTAYEYRDFKGEEKAGELVGGGSSQTLIGPEPCLGISKPTRKKIIPNCLQAEHQKRWLSYTGGIHTKFFRTNISKKWSDNLLNPHKSEIRKVVRVPTNHSQLNTFNFIQSISPLLRALIDSWGGVDIRYEILTNFTIQNVYIPPMDTQKRSNFLVNTLW